MAMIMPLSGAQKTALLLLLLEEHQAGSILARLAPADVERIGRAMLAVSEASPDMIATVLDEVLAIAGQTVAVGDGPPTVRHMFGDALGPDRSAGMVERLGPSARAPIFERLAWLEPAAIAGLLEREHPQAIALILSSLTAESAADVLALLPASTQGDVVRRVALLRPVAPQVAEALDRRLTDRLSAVPARQPLADLGGIGRAAALINGAGLAEEDMVAGVALVDKAAAEALQDALFTFADLVRMPERALQTLVRSLDAELLIPALRGTTEEMKAKLLAAMPQRAAESLADEMASRGPIRMDEAETAQKAIAGMARRLAAEGSISLPGKGPAYV